MDKINGNDAEWRFFSDQVMGGRSAGSATRMSDDTDTFFRMKGLVTTENNGGFIQIRANVLKLPDNIKGVELRVRGNGERYYVFLRTTGTVLPWQYYKAEFKTSGDWKKIQLPFNKFERSSSWLRKTIAPGAIKSIGIVAFGEDYEALIDVERVNFFD